MKAINQLVLALSMLITLSVTAQQGINYKALIKDGGGNVVANDLIVVQFQILQGVGMTNVYQETHTPTTDANGLIILNIGEGSVNSGIYADIDWGSDDHYLNVQINTGGGLTDMGTTQFMAVPYALSAANAATKIDELSDGKSDADGSSVFLGLDAGLNDDGTDNENVAVGFEALYSNTEGFRNTANGHKTLYNNLGGRENTATGERALYSNTEGYWNTATGFQSLYFNSTGIGNTANGFQALNRGNVGLHNTAIGAQALFFNEGSYNTVNGFKALRSNITGNANTVNGYFAGYNNLGNGNVFMGYHSGYTEVGSNTLYIENTDADADNALIYGEFGADNTTTGNILRTNSEFQIGNPANTGFAFPLQDGTTDQVLQTDGNGSLSWNASVNSINDLTDGKSVGGSVFLGIDAGLNEDGTYNWNVGIGYQALYSNTEGIWNTANGSYALYGNTSGFFNTANGSQALYYNTTGYSNTANGYQALYFNDTGYDNTATGLKSLFENISGTKNTAIGFDALNKNLSGHKNTANGSQALFSNTTGNNNTANGYQALFNNLVDNNTANGYQALYSNTTGHSNTANGYQALFFNSSGYENTANGYRALYNNLGFRNTANGHSALVANTTGSLNTASGWRALYQNTTGSNNTAIGNAALINNTTGSNNTAIGFNAQVPNGAGSGQVRIGGSIVNYAGVQVAWDITSDKRWKNNIRELPYGLDFVKQLQPVDYVRKNNEHKTREMGFIAQDVEALLTKIGYKDQGLLHKDDKGFMSLRYNDFIALLTKAIQEQQEIIEEQNSKLEKQDTDIKELMAWKQKVDQIIGMN